MLYGLVKHLVALGVLSTSKAPIQNAINENAFRGFKDCIDNILKTGEEFNYEGTICLLIDKLATDSEINLHNEFAYRALVYLASKRIKSAQETDWGMIIEHIGETRIRNNASFTGYTHMGLSRSIVRDILGLLIKEFDFDINTQTHEGVTLLMYAVNSRLMDKDMLEFMVVLGADINKMSEVYGRPIHFINKADFNSYHKFAYLVTLGAKPCEDVTFKAFVNKGIDFVQHTYYRGLKDYLASASEVESSVYDGNISEMLTHLDKIELNDVNLNVLLAANHYIESERIKQVRLSI